MSVLIRIECALNSHSIAIVGVHTECAQVDPPTEVDLNPDRDDSGRSAPK